jgi:hypothetical protein
MRSGRKNSSKSLRRKLGEGAPSPNFGRTVFLKSVEHDPVRLDRRLDCRPLHPARSRQTSARTIARAVPKVQLDSRRYWLVQHERPCPIGSGLPREARVVPIRQGSVVAGRGSTLAATRATVFHATRHGSRKRSDDEYRQRP